MKKREFVEMAAVELRKQVTNLYHEAEDERGVASRNEWSVRAALGLLEQLEKECPGDG